MAAKIRDLFAIVMAWPSLGLFKIKYDLGRFFLFWLLLGLPQGKPDQVTRKE